MAHLEAVLALAGCDAALPSSDAVARHEAKRLSRVHEDWLAQSPRKVDMQEFPSAELSPDARSVGFVKATVSQGAVRLWTQVEHDRGQGLLVGQLTGPEQAGLQRLGFVLESTAARDICRFTLVPNQAADRIPGSGAPGESDRQGTRHRSC